MDLGAQQKGEPMICRLATFFCGEHSKAVRLGALVGKLTKFVVVINCADGRCEAAEDQRR